MILVLVGSSFVLFAGSYWRCKQGDFRREVSGWSPVLGLLLGLCGLAYGLSRLI